MDDGNVWLALALLIILILINGTLASMEIAMIGLSEHRLRPKAEAGDKKARMLLKMKENPSNFLSTVQVGITLAGLLSGAFAADTLAAPLVSGIAALGVSGAWLTVLRAVITVLITLLMTYFMLVFGELVPKRVAMARPEQTADRAIGLVNALSVAAKPLVRLLAKSTNLTLRLTGIDPDDTDTAVTEEEILLMMREGEEQGAIEPDEIVFMSNVFAFSDLRVEDAMTHRTEIEAVSVDTDIAGVALKIARTGLNKLPVYEGSVDEIIGILYGKDIVTLALPTVEGKPPPTVREAMRPPFFVPETMRLIDLFEEMKKSGNRMAVVVDEYGGTSGIITLMDIVEEIVGSTEISAFEGIEDLGDGEYLLDGSMEIEEAADFLGLDGDSLDEFDTLSGFIVNTLGYIPVSGERPEIRYRGYLMRAEEMNGGVIRRVFVGPDRGE